MDSFIRRLSSLFLLVYFMWACGTDESNGSVSRLANLPGACQNLGSIAASIPSETNLLAGAHQGEEKVFSRMIVLGDSLSDTGNLRDRSQIRFFGPVLLPSCVYWQGRFSNGPNWLDYVAPIMAAETINFAVGGAATRERAWDASAGFFRVLSPSFWMESLGRLIIPSLKEQLNAYLSQKIETNQAKKSSLDPDGFSEAAQNELVVIWIGANNYLNEGVTVQNEKGLPDLEKAKKLVAETNADIEDAIRLLVEHGHRHIAVGTMPELAGLPDNPDDPDPVSDVTYRLLTKLHNDLIKKSVDQQRSRRPELNLFMFNAYLINQQTIDDPLGFGFNDIYNPCYKGGLFGPFSDARPYCENYFGQKLWDWVHPNSKMHCFYAHQFLKDWFAQSHSEKASSLSYDQQKGFQQCMSIGY